MIEFEEKFNDKEDVIHVKMDITTCDGISEVKKDLRGVNKVGNKWRARIQHPKLKYEINLGRYSSLEEAALVVKKKKAEYEETCKGDENIMDMETSSADYEGTKLPAGVYRRTYRRWGAHIWHPKLKRNVSLGSYNTMEEAAMVVESKRAELWNLYGRKQKVKPARTYDDKVLKKVDCKVVSMFEISDELTGDLKMPAGVAKTKSGKWGVRIRDPKSRARIWLGTFASAEDAVRSFYKAKGELYAKRNRTKSTSNSSAGGERSETSEGSNLARETQFVQATRSDKGLKAEKAYRTVTADLCHKIASNNENLNRSGCSSGFDEAVSLGSDILNNVAKHERLPTMVFEPRNSNNVDVGDKLWISQGNEQNSGCASGFDEAMSSDIINEYGQLMGMYTELDETMEFSLPDDHIADLGP